MQFADDAFDPLVAMQRHVLRVFIANGAEAAGRFALAKRRVAKTAGQ